MRRIALGSAIAFAFVLAVVPSLEAQAIRAWTLTGRLTDGEGKAIDEATIRVTQGPRTLLARSDGTGVYRVTDVGEGTWIVAVRRVGYRPLLDTIAFDPKGLRRDYTMGAAATGLDAVVVHANWTGVRGVVGDIRLLSPLAGARVVAMGTSGEPVETDVDGRFEVSLAPGTEVVLRVEREGFARQLVTAKVPADGFVELDVPLDTLRGDERREMIAFEDLESRLAFATPRAARLLRAELQRSDAARLDVALREVGTLTAKGIRVPRFACLFVNGEARPGFPIDAVPIEDIEFVEIYPEGSDLSRTLAIRWPPRGECSAAPGATRGASAAHATDGFRRPSDPQAATFVVVWTKAQ